MKFVGFEIPRRNWGELDWLYDVTEDNGDTIFYVVEAKNADQAREKIFKEIYNNCWDYDDRKEAANRRAWTVLQDLEEKEVIKKYGENDGQKIISISNEYLDLKEHQQNEMSPTNPIISELSEKSIYELAFEDYICDIGISKCIKIM